MKSLKVATKNQVIKNSIIKLYIHTHIHTHVYMSGRQPNMVTAVMRSMDAGVYGVYQ